MASMDDSDSTADETAEWAAVGKSLNPGRFIEQDTAHLLCEYLGVTVYVIAHIDNFDHLQVTKCAGESLRVAIRVKACAAFYHL